uniref:Beta-1,4-galactosyltransferase n=2 Tax=Clytia hemisphaerica TaxID=252671 RepID=A0A7M5V9E0_9CNID
MYYYQHLLCTMMKDFARFERTKSVVEISHLRKSYDISDQRTEQQHQDSNTQNHGQLRNMNQPKHLQQNEINRILNDPPRKQHIKQTSTTLNSLGLASDGLKPTTTLRYSTTISQTTKSLEQSEQKITFKSSQKETQRLSTTKKTSGPPDMTTLRKEQKATNHQQQQPENKALPSCQRKESILKDGRIAINRTVPSSYQQIYENLSSDLKQNLQRGGSYKPSTCKPNCTTAIIIPYKARENQLKIFLRHMHPILHRSQIGYRIFVIEQNDTHPFNRAKLFNVGFHEAITRFSRNQFSCFVFHDVDLLLENELNNYCCKDSPRYMCPAIDVWGYRSFSPYSFGGVVGLTEADFKKVNGYSNKYWGWGSEDDDLHWRLRHSGVKINRPPMTEGRYSMLTHKKQARNGKAILMLKKTEKGFLDSHENGLTTLKYEVKNVEEKTLFTHIFVNLQMTVAERNLTDVGPT